MERIIDLGKYIEIGINALEENFSFLWSAMDEGITWIVDSINSLLLGTPFIVFLIIVILLAYYAKTGNKMFKKEGIKEGIGLVLFIVIGLSLIYAIVAEEFPLSYC